MIRAILSRRSVREGFTGEPIPPAVLEAIVACGLSAPSSKNAQPFRLHVITDRAVLGHLAQQMAQSEGVADFVPKDPETGAVRSEYHSTVVESAEVLRNCSAAIVIENLGKFSVSRNVLAERAQGDQADILLGYALEILGIGAGIENMLLAASASGLGATFMGDPLIIEPEIKRTLKVANDLAGIVTLGTVADHGAQAERHFEVRASDRVRWHQ